MVAITLVGLFLFVIGLSVVSDDKNSVLSRILGALLVLVGGFILLIPLGKLIIMAIVAIIVIAILAGTSKLIRG